MRDEVLKKLEKLNIEYKEVKHKEVFSIEEIDELGDIFDGAMICKNIFLRDQKGKRHFLVIISGHKQVPLNSLMDKIGSTRLSFASEKRLMKYLKLKPGSVSPFALINDEEGAVEVYIDSDLKNEKLIGFHPCINTSLVLIKPEDLEKYINSTKSSFRYIKI